MPDARWSPRGIDSSIDAMAPFFWLLLAGVPALLQGSQTLDPDPTHPRVRALDRTARQIVSDGAGRSPTVAGLLAALEQQDVVVYVVTNINLPQRGVLTFAARAASLTYVIVSLDPKQDADTRLAALAHELTHAVEVAESDRPIGSERDLEELYRRIGFPEGRGQFESARALANETRAKRDLTLEHALPHRDVPLDVAVFQDPRALVFQ